MAGRASLGMRACALAALASLTSAGIAKADLRTTVKASRSVDRTCHAGLARAGASGVDVRRYTAEASGLVHARLTGQGDWDLGVFDARTRRSVAGSAALRANELAEGFVRRGQRLIVQACRVRGASSSANLRISTIALPQARAASDGPTQVVSVRTDRRGVRVLQTPGSTSPSTWGRAASTSCSTALATRRRSVPPAWSTT